MSDRNSISAPHSGPSVLSIGPDRIGGSRRSSNSSLEPDALALSGTHTSRHEHTAHFTGARPFHLIVMIRIDGRDNR